MVGFRNVREYVDACEGGKNWITQWRKALVNGPTGWTDISNGVGSYPSNFFASTPLVAAQMPAGKGIFIPSTGVRKYIKDSTIMIPAPSATSTNTDLIGYYLLDWLMYYPFIDLASVDLQEFENPVSLPRYTDGAGLQLVLVLQAGNGNYTGSQMTINYTNQSGGAKSVVVALAWSPFQSYSVVGAPVAVAANTAPPGPFVSLSFDDYGIRSIQSVQLSADWGGLGCLAIVKPVIDGMSYQSCRRTTSGALDSFGSPSQVTNLIHRVNGSYIEDGAYLSPIMHFKASAGGVLACGTLETVWND